MKKILAIILVVCMCVPMAACAEKEEAVVETLKVPVEAAVPVRGDLAVMTTFMGTVSPEEEVMVYPLVSGTVTEVNVKLGDRVAEGDVLFCIDDTMAQLQLDSARASYETAAANVAMAEGASRNLQNSQTEAQIDALWLQLQTYGETYYDTGSQLDDLDSQIASLENAASTAQSVYTAAQAEYEAAKAAYQAALASNAAVPVQPAATEENPTSETAESVAEPSNGTDSGETGAVLEEEASGDVAAEPTDAAVGASEAAEGETPASTQTEDTQTEPSTGGADTAGTGDSYLNTAVSEAELAQLKAQMELKKETANEAKAIYDQAMSAIGSLEATSGQLESAMDQTDAAYRQASESMRAALEAYDITRGQLYPQQNEANDAQLAATHVGIDSAEAQLAFYTVKAPIGGIIEDVVVEKNGMAAAGNPALMISNKENMMVRFGVTEAVAKSLKTGDMVEVERNGAVYPAVISEIGTMANQQTRLFTVKASLGQADDLPTGVSVKVKTEGQKAPDVMKLPYDALYFLGGKAYVYCVVDGKAVMTEVITGLMNDEEVEILSGIEPDSLVISTWSSQLKDGAEVELKEENAAQGIETKPGIEIITGKDVG